MLVWKSPANPVISVVFQLQQIVRNITELFSEFCHSITVYRFFLIGLSTGKYLFKLRVAASFRILSNLSCSFRPLWFQLFMHELLAIIEFSMKFFIFL